MKVYELPIIQDMDFDFKIKAKILDLIGWHGEIRPQPQKC